MFVTKLSAAGVPVYSTYLGASDADQAEGIALDANGFIYVTGVTSSIDFPIRNAFQSSLNGPSDAFLVELDAGGAIVRSTFLGGSSDDIGVGVAPDGAGGIIVGGMTDSTDFPTASAVQATPGGMGDAFVTRFDAGGALVYSTYLGGGALDSVNGLAADASGQAYVTGFTQSTDFPVASAFQPTNHTTDPVNGGNGFVTKLSATGTFVYSTYLGGSNSDSGDGIRTDGAGAAYLVGQTSSLDFPTASAFQPTHHGGQWDAFVAKLDASGTPVFSTFLGGSGRDFGRKIALDSAGAVLVTGFTQSPDFPVLGSIQAPRAGYDAFVTKLKPGGGALAYSTYLGGDGDEFAEALAVDAAGAAYVAGSTSSTNFPTRLPFQPTNHGGQSDAFVARLSPFTPAAVPAGSKTTIALLALLLVAVSIRLLGRRPPGRA